jgi:hypothetical protein
LVTEVSTLDDALLTNARRVELRGVYAQDLVPDFPLPPFWVEAASVPALPAEDFIGFAPEISLRLEERALYRCDCAQMYRDLVAFSHMAAVEAASWKEPPNSPRVGSWVNPMAHRLLSMRPLEDPQLADAMLQEACRLAFLVYLGPVWRFYGAHPISTQTFIWKLQQLLGAMAEYWTDLWQLELWIVYLGAIEALPFPEHDWFVHRLHDLMVYHRVDSWAQLRVVVRAVLWMDVAFDGLDTDLRLEMEQGLSSSRIADLQAER